MIETCDASSLHEMLGGRREIAVIDVREKLPYGRANILWSVNIALSILELKIEALVPRKSTPIVLVDAGEGLAGRAAVRLKEMGYDTLRILEGGVSAWTEAGHIPHHEIRVAVKGFTAFAERHGQPHFIEPTELKARLDRGDDWIVLDSRPPAEFQTGNIPGSIDVPGPEVLCGFYDLVPSAATNVVVNCATRTRGIIGGLTLMAAGVPNKVHVLQNGTLGWILDGLVLENGADRRVARPTPQAHDKALQAMSPMIRKAGIRRIDGQDLEAWRRETERTTYIFDVRDPMEYRSGHIAGAVNAPFGNLIMGFEDYFATLNGRVVLTDDDGIRAGLTAVWLAQIGACEPYVLASQLGDLASESPSQPSSAVADAGFVEVRELAGLCDQQAVLIVDLDTSRNYRLGHIPGAVWMLRSELNEKLPAAFEPSIEGVVLTSQDDRLARLAAPEATALMAVPVRVLRGGNQAWKAAGLAFSDKPERLLSEPKDYWIPSTERPNPQQSMRDYLEWETHLLGSIENDGPVRYRNLLWP